MRLILFFDLPVEKSSQRRAYTQFIKNIKKLGFYMLQESVYLKLCNDNRMSSSIQKQIKEIAPNDGSIAILEITEKQFSTINFIIGDHYSNIINSDDRIIEL